MWLAAAALGLAGAAAGLAVALTSGSSPSLPSTTLQVRFTPWSLAFSPDGRTLAAGGADGVTTMWGVATHRITASLTGQDRAVQSAAFSPDGAILATSSYDNTVRLRRTRS